MLFNNGDTNVKSALLKPDSKIAKGIVGHKLDQFVACLIRRRMYNFANIQYCLL